VVPWSSVDISNGARGGRSERAGGHSWSAWGRGAGGGAPLIKGAMLSIETCMAEFLPVVLLDCQSRCIGLVQWVPMPSPWFIH
jgi:hypothetical protein